LKGVSKADRGGVDRQPASGFAAQRFRPGIHAGFITRRSDAFSLVHEAYRIRGFSHKIVLVVEG
jgi:hypothetical protein